MEEKVGSGRAYINLNVGLRDLDLKADTFKVEVLPSPAIGETNAPVQVPYGVERLRRALGDLEAKRIEREDLAALGTALMDRLFPDGPVRQLFLDGLRKAGLDGGLRVRLFIYDPRLANLPWEFTCLPQNGWGASHNSFLVLNPQISLVRHVPQSREYVSPRVTDVVERAIRMVVAIADVQDARFAPLGLDEERQAIETALQELRKRGVSFTLEAVLENPSRQDLVTALQAGCHIFHFAGHGVFRQAAFLQPTGEWLGAGFLVLVADPVSRKPQYVPADVLAAYLQQAGARVVVLGACGSGRHDGLFPWMGVAPALVERGIPAVVAMQYDVMDHYAVAFARRFYLALVDGLSVDEAVSLARLEMFEGAQHAEVEWGVPVLYMRTDEPRVVLFPAGGPSEAQNVAALEEEADPLELYELLVNHFSMTDIKDICLRVTHAFKKDGISEKLDPELLGGKGKREVAYEIVGFLEKRGYLGYLVQVIRAVRPDLSV